MQAKQDAVEAVAMLARAVADQARDMVKRLTRHTRAGGGMGRDGMGDQPACLAAYVEKPGEFFVDVAEAVDGGLAQIQHIVAEVLQGGFAALEGVAFVDEGGGQDVEGHIWAFKAGGNRRWDAWWRPAPGVQCGSGLSRADSVRQRRSRGADRTGWGFHR